MMATFNDTTVDGMEPTIEENCSLWYDQIREHNLTLDPNHTCYFMLDSMLGAEEFFGSFGPPWWVHLLVQILYGIVCLIGLAGNTLVIYVVVRFSKMQTVTNLYIVNLAIADECFLIGVPFLVVTAVLGYWPFGEFFCKAYFTTTSINQITSSMFLLVMSADRYLAVCHPINAPKYRTPLIAKVVALTAWTLSALLMVPIFMYASTLEINNKKPDPKKEFAHYFKESGAAASLQRAMGLLYRMPVKPTNLAEFFSQYFENGAQQLMRISLLKAEVCYKRDELQNIRSKVQEAESLIKEMVDKLGLTEEDFNKRNKCGDSGVVISKQLKKFYFSSMHLINLSCFRYAVC